MIFIIFFVNIIYHICLNASLYMSKNILNGVGTHFTTDFTKKAKLAANSDKLLPTVPAS